MVKRITASLLLVLVGAISILAQIDYNKQIKNLPPITQGNLANIRIVDGLKFAKSAAGINAADADLGDPFNTGEIWVPATQVTATDAQISISPGHKLRIFGTLIIDAVNKGPILLGSGASITCVPAPDNSANIQQSGAGTVPSMVRLAAQDGSQSVGMVIEGCDIFAGTNPVTNGVVDATGSINRGWIRDSKLRGHTSGWGIFIQDIQTGAMGGTNTLQILNNYIAPTSTGGCIEITHSATNAVGLSNFDIQDTTCIAGGSITTAPILLVNANTSSGLVTKITMTNTNMIGTPAAQPNLTVNGVGSLSIRQLICSTGSACLNIPSAIQNLAVVADSIFCFSCTNTVVDTANSVTISNISVGHYDLPVPAIPTYSGTYNTIYKATIANLNNIRIVDGVRFAKNAAGINAADADLGGLAGEIWIPSGITIATDAQVSIAAAHTLRIFGQLTIDALNRGPILLGGNSRIVCVGNYGATNIANTSAQTNITSMVRLSTQDGSLGGIEIDGCRFDSQGSTVTNGMIDASGAVNGPSYIKENLIAGFTSGWGIFVQDIQSGALNGTNNVIISNNRIVATGTGGCIEILHSATNAVVLNGFNIIDNNCTPGGTSTSSVLLQNTSNDGGRLRDVNIMRLLITGTPSGQSAMQVNGVRALSVRHMFCSGSSTNCVALGNNGNNQTITLDTIVSDSGNNVLNDAQQSIVTGGSSLMHYDQNSGLTGYNYLTDVSYLKVQGLAPASCTSTGTGTGPTCTFAGNPTNNAGIMQIVAGTTPGSSGTFTLNFGTTQTNFGGSTPSCVFTPHSTTGVWNPRVSIILFSTTNTAVQANWDNNAVNLTAGSQYNIHYWCVAH